LEVSPFSLVIFLFSVFEFMLFGFNWISEF